MKEEYFYPKLSNLCKMAETFENTCLIKRFSHAGEQGHMRILPLFPGISLSHNNIHMHSIPFNEKVKVNYLLINYCIEGRCEVNLGNKGFVFMEKGYLSVDSNNAQDDFISPEGYYKGIEVFFDLDQLSQQSSGLLNSFDVDIFLLKNFLCKNGMGLLFVPPEPIQKILDKLSCTLTSETVVFHRLKLLELLYELSRLDFSLIKKTKTWLTKGQTAIAKSVYKQICSDLSKKHVVAQLAQTYGISQTSLRNYFYQVYGESIPSVIREKRVKKAMELLEQSELSVMKIAQETGYENQSKFAAVFKTVTGDSPLEYRRKNKYQGGTYGYEKFSTSESR